MKNSDINVSGDDTINLSKVLLLWIHQRPCDEVHWKKVINTIKDPPIENIDLANEICHFLANPHNQKGKKQIVKNKQKLCMYNLFDITSYIMKCDIRTIKI